MLPHTGVVGACTVSVVQPSYLEVDYTSETVTLECTFSTTGCSSKQPRSLWFRCGAHQPEALCLDGCRSKADKFTVEETLDQNRVSLTVNRVSPNDSAIYICGIAFPHEPAPRAKQTGSGTTLVVRGPSTGPRHICCQLQNGGKPSDFLLLFIFLSFFLNQLFKRNQALLQCSRLALNSWLKCSSCLSFPRSLHCRHVLPDCLQSLPQTAQGTGLVKLLLVFM